MAIPQNRANDRPAALALIGICVIFIAIVGRGWQGLFVPYGFIVSVALGLAVAAIASALAYAIAAERVQNPHSLGTASAYFFILFNISALGTVNAMFVTFQSANVFRQEIEKSQAAVNSLKTAGSDYLSTQLRPFDRFSAAVDDNLKALTDEIENPNLCGQGPVAAQHAKALQGLLPNFRVLAGGGDCKKAKETADVYRRKVPDLVKTSSQYLESKDFIELRERLARDSDGLLSRLQTTQKMLSSGSSNQSTKSNLYEIAEDYSLLRQKFKPSMLMDGSAVVDRIDTSAVSALGDIGQVLPFLLSRLGEISTYIYLTIALILDLTVIAAFARVLRSGPDNRQRLAVSKPKLL